jgi:hypothetical protein
VNEIAKQLLICLVASHFVGDFIFQSDKDASNKLRPLILLKHSFIVAILSYVLCGVWTQWRIPLVIFCTHPVIDWIKEKAVKREGLSNKWGIYAFLIDQAAHIFIIIILAITITPVSTVAGAGANAISLFWVDLFGKGFLKLLIVLSGAILAVKAGGILIGMAVRPFLDEIKNNENDVDMETKTSSRGLKNGGKVIGQLERSLIFLFILMGQLSGIGFLIAAKSVFRFGEVKDPKHRMEAEYIIIGTLMSFGYGMLIAYATKFFVGLVK